MGKFGVKRDLIREKILKISEKVRLKKFFKNLCPFLLFMTPL